MDLGLGKKAAPSPQAGFDQAKLFVWVKALESKVNNLVRELDVLKNDFTKKNSQLSKDFKTLNSDIMDFKHEQTKMSTKMDLIIKELKQTAGIEQVNTIKKYMEYWNPMNFVTQTDLDRAIQGKIDMLQTPARKEEQKE